MRQLAYQSQQQTQKQGYYLSLQHMQFMHLLHLSGYALDEYLQNQLEENPLLEKSESENDDTDITPDISETEPASDLSTEYEEYFEEYDSYIDKNSFASNTKDVFQSNAARFESFTEQVKSQISLMDLTEEEKNIAYYIVDDLEPDGYLKRTSQDIADNYSAWSGKLTETWQIENAINSIQKCDPPGVASRSLRECLLIQLNRLEKNHPLRPVATCILNDQFKAFLNRDFKKIMTKMNISESTFQEALQLIHSLNPKPNTFQDEYETLSNQITPAIEVTLEEDEFNISIVNSPYANIRINPGYENINTLLQTKKNKKSEKKYWSKMLNEAHSLIIAIRQREKTMMAVMCSILKLQTEFFRYGEKKLLRPMTLEQVAELASCDISTVSRITSNKYVQTSHGCYLLKTLFSGFLQSGKEQISSHTVKEMIVDLIEQENKTKPLTDNQIVETLREKGITIARRTIVKYRDMLGVPNHSMRHSLN